MSATSSASLSRFLTFPIQHLRTTIDAMAGTITRQIERRKSVVKGSFTSFESIPDPCDSKGSERIDMEHVHAHVLLAVPKGQAGSRRMKVFEGYRDHKVITAGSAISGAYYNCKTSVLGWFTENWQASLEHNFTERVLQLSGFHRYRTTGVFKDRELPADQQKSLEQIEAELNAAAVSPTHPTIPPTQHEQEHPTCVAVSIPPQPRPERQRIHHCQRGRTRSYRPASSPGHLPLRRQFRTRWDRVRRSEARPCGCSRLEMRDKLRKALQRRDMAAATARSRYLCDDLNPLSILWRPIRVDELSDHGPCAWAGRTVTIGYNATALPK
jgi:hypothetical protein